MRQSFWRNIEEIEHGLSFIEASLKPPTSALQKGLKRKPLLHYSLKKLIQSDMEVAMASPSLKSLLSPSLQPLVFPSSQPVDSASIQPVDSPPPEPVDSPSPQPVDSASSKYMDATIIEIADPSLDHLTVYQPLYKAILEGKLKDVQKICNRDLRSLEARITLNSDTALHLAVGTGMTANSIVDYLLNKMSTDQLELKNNEGNTVLSVAAIVGNVEAAKKIRKKLPELDYIENNFGHIPLIEAVRHCQKEMINYLLQFNIDYLQLDRDSANKTGVLFMISLINAGFYDLVLDLVTEHQSLATTEFNGGESLLSAIVRKPSAFPSGKLHLWTRDIILLLAICFKDGKSGKTWMNFHKTVLNLVKLLCTEITEKLDHERAFSILKGPFLLAIKLGVQEVVEEIIELFPGAVWFSDEENHNAFQLAVINRQEKIFNLIYQKSSYHKHLFLGSKDKFGNNILHLAGQLAPQNHLKYISTGAALQMQYELQWFQGIEKIVQPTDKEDKNSAEKTPAMVFAEAHTELVKEGEKWMKDAAMSYSIAAALIATVVFAAAITIPGDYKDDGVPTFYRQPAFRIFSTADAISLFTSMASILIFLSVLTARYAEYDFLYVLPMRFILGLVLLLVSVASMMVTSVITVYLVFSERKTEFFSLTIIYAALLAYLFTFTQVPLLVEMLNSTVGPGLFRKQITSMQRIKLKIISLF